MFRAFATVTLAAGLLLLPPSAAHAQPGPGRGDDGSIGAARKGCTGARCDGLDPIALGCDAGA
ncbi:hypothetical protein ACWEPC_58025, partial [Nonomuraea sp. NPDC004297]